MKMYNRKGFTLADIIVILVLVTIMATGGMVFYVSLLNRHQEVTQYMKGVSLAVAQVEDLMAMDYTAQELSIGNNQTATITVPAGYTLSYDIYEHDYGDVNVVGKEIHANVITPPLYITTSPEKRTIKMWGHKIKR